MIEILLQFDEPERAADGQCYAAQVLGRRTRAGLWEGWVEFVPFIAGGDLIRGACETTQLTRGDLRYWATRLTHADLAAALEGALTRGAVESLATAACAGTQPDGAVPGGAHEPYVAGVPGPPLSKLPDLLTVYAASGTRGLRRALRPLDANELRMLIAEYDIPELDAADLARTFEDALAERIVAGVQQHVERARRMSGPILRGR